MQLPELTTVKLKNTPKGTVKLVAVYTLVAVVPLKPAGEELIVKGGVAETGILMVSCPAELRQLKLESVLTVKVHCAFTCITKTSNKACRHIFLSTFKGLLLP